MKTSRFLIMAGLALGLLSTTSASAWPGPSPAGKICRDTPSGRRCIDIKAPPPPEGCHCDDASCWCGPADAYPGEDESGLPLLAREAEDAGWSCDVVEVDGVVTGNCGIVGWTCGTDWCEDTGGNVWPLIRLCPRPCGTEFGGVCWGRCLPKKPPAPIDCDPSTQSCGCDPAVSSCP